MSMEYGSIGDWQIIIVRRIVRGDISSVVRACLDKRINTHQIVVACSAALQAHTQLLIARILRREKVVYSLELRLKGRYKVLLTTTLYEFAMVFHKITSNVK